MQKIIIFLLLLSPQSSTRFLFGILLHAAIVQLFCCCLAHFKIIIIIETVFFIMKLLQFLCWARVKREFMGWKWWWSEWGLLSEVKQEEFKIFLTTFVTKKSRVSGEIDENLNFIRIVFFLNASKVFKENSKIFKSRVFF